MHYMTRNLKTDAYVSHCPFKRWLLGVSSEDRNHLQAFGIRELNLKEVLSLRDPISRRWLYMFGSSSIVCLLYYTL